MSLEHYLTLSVHRLHVQSKIKSVGLQSKHLHPSGALMAIEGRHEMQIVNVFGGDFVWSVTSSGGRSFDVRIVFDDAEVGSQPVHSRTSGQRGTFDSVHRWFGRSKLGNIWYQFAISDHTIRLSSKFVTICMYVRKISREISKRLSILNSKSNTFGCREKSLT